MKGITILTLAALGASLGCNPAVRTPRRPRLAATRSPEPLPQEAPSRNLEPALDALAADLLSGITLAEGHKVAVVEFASLEGRSTPLGKYLAEELTTRLFRARRFAIVERQLLDRMLAEQKLGASGLLDESTASRLGRLVGADALITGTITDLSDHLKVHARLITTESGAVSAVASASLPMDSEVARLWERKGGAPAPGRFDGDWEVDIGCSAQDGGLPYHLRFVAHVRGGAFQGQYGTEGSSPFLSVEGTVGPDGHAVLLATGTTGDARFSIRNAPPGLPLLLPH
jgi:TolB-like protein